MYNECYDEVLPMLKAGFMPSVTQSPQACGGTSSYSFSFQT